MSKITRDDLQHISDANTLMHFLDEKLNLPIPEKAVLEEVALPLPLSYLGLEKSVAEQIIDCHDFGGLPQSLLDKQRPFLIRFKSGSRYPEILRQMAESLSQKNIRPTEVFFICTAENFQPFAFARFNDSGANDWHTEGLDIWTWVQDNTRINAGFGHERSVFFSSQVKSDRAELAQESAASRETKPGRTGRRSVSTRAEDLLIKLQNSGKPLGEYADIRLGVSPGYNNAFVIDEETRAQLLDEDPASVELIKPLLAAQKWMGELKYIICLRSSTDREWPWSSISDTSEAKQIFKETYPAISAHMDPYRDALQARSFHKNGSAVFYWELPSYRSYAMLEASKIFYSYRTVSLKAAYDPHQSLLLGSVAFFPTDDISLLTILNSKLFGWYAYKKHWVSELKCLFLLKRDMSRVPIVRRSEGHKDQLSELVQRILDARDGPSVRDLEQEIDDLVYELYNLTAPEVALIERGYNHS